MASFIWLKTIKNKHMKKILTVIAVAVIAFSMPGCKSKVKDADVKTSVEAALRGNPDYTAVMVDVTDGVATLSGEVKDETAKAGAEASTKEVKGVKSVTNNISIALPPAPPPASVEVTSDDALTTAVKDAIKDNTGVMADVKDGVITLTGEIRKTDLPKLMQKLNALKPKKIENKLTIK